MSMASHRRGRSGRAKRPERGYPVAGREESARLVLLTLQRFRLIFAAARAYDAEIRQSTGMPSSQLWALSEVARAPALSVTGLAERMAVHQTTASNLLNALVERKLVRRVRDAADQRIVRLHATTEGKRVLLGAPGPYVGLLVDALRHLDGKQLAALNKSLDKVIGSLRETKPTAAGQTLLGE
jgi:DNA-binding MarR family transcriptional regulator